MKSIVTSILFFMLIYHTPLFSQNWSLVWSDEFKTNTLNEENWNIITGNGCPNLCGWGNGEFQYYTDDPTNIYIQNGVLNLNVTDEGHYYWNQEGQWGYWSDFSSARITSEAKFDQTYGRFEARIRMPSGNGLWPAFWMLRHDNNWPTTGEIDIMEYRGDIQDETHGTVHYGASWPANQWNGGSYDANMDLSEDFHIYAIEWSADSIKWFFDDVVFKILTRDPRNYNNASNGEHWPWDEDFYIILNNAVGGWFAGNPSVDEVRLTKPNLEIDYVRVYEETKAVTVDIKVLLESTYVGDGNMNNELNGLIPSLEPYSALGYYALSNSGEMLQQEVLEQTGNDKVIDWILLELRNQTNPTEVLTSKCGLLLADGRVVESDGTTPIIFYTNALEAYLVVKHRNHLGVMTSSPLDLSIGTISVDLRSLSNIYVNTELSNSPLKEVSTEVYGLYKGDVNNDGRINTTDASIVFSNAVPLVNEIYDINDVNMDGDISTSDAVEAFENAVPVKVHHLPDN